MNILVLNSSGKKERSRSFKVAKAFIEGLKENKYLKEEKNIYEVHLFDKNINSCIGCYNCWKNDGKCIQHDDMDDLLFRYLEADIVIWIFPLTFYGFPSKMRCAIERLLPIFTAKMAPREDGGYIHLNRYETKRKREIFISTCGFPSEINNYEGVKKVIKIMHPNNSDYIFCSEGSIFEVDKFSNIINRYLKKVTIAGREFSFENGLDNKSKKRLSEQLLPEDLYMAKSNSDDYWLNF
ncbi:MAG: flavodoxin family protein [Clostridium sp.]|uniref:flavodoxin family protein n=1 Tax=Clostridium sp. DSM 8431 TaxID=1761781 RepID=UPI0008F38669|nr:flavodoxin family protein [Clostridium sp. DSM 8431]MCR4944912.1 flavodoxin family protein [Clostridium sp.]SFU34451.1 Flavodoxin-like fold [Clostridium sp. DSM 8431]